MLNRRSLITGLISFVAAPAIVRASSLMPVKAVRFIPVTMYDHAKLLRKIELNVTYGKIGNLEAMRILGFDPWQ